MFWRAKPKPPWYKKLWSEWRQLFVSLTTVFGLLGSGYAYVAVDVRPFIATTSIVSIATQDTAYVRLTAEAEIHEQTYIIVNIDGQQVRALVFPKGIREGVINMEIPIPFTSTGEYLRVNVEVVVVGPRTLFIPTTLEQTIKVKRQEAGNAGTNGNSNVLIPYHPGSGQSV